MCLLSVHFQLQELSHTNQYIDVQNEEGPYMAHMHYLGERIAKYFMATKDQVQTCDCTHTREEVRSKKSCSF